MTSRPVRPRLPDGVVRVGEPEPVGTLAERFLPFAALHHGLEMNSPVSASMLDAAVAAMQLQPDHRALDIACGNGALLWRFAERTGNAVGIDLSPWALEAAASRLSQKRLHATLWHGDATAVSAEPAWDAIACVGAGWIFHGHAGTIRAVQRRLRPGGVALFGDLRARSDSSDRAVTTQEEQHTVIAELGGAVVLDLTSDDETWDAYGASVMAAADRFHAEHPTLAAADQRSLAARWIAEALEDRTRLDFALTVVRFDH